MKLEDVKNLGKVKCPNCGNMVSPKKLNDVLKICPKCNSKI
jgi:Zn finger protein HypA/HybF involved in hydrogenase expression